MFEFLHKKHIKEEQALVLVVQSDKVSASVISFTTLDMPVVHFEYTKHFHTHHDRLSPSLILSHVKEVTEHTLFSLSHLNYVKEFKNLKIYTFLSGSLHDEHIIEKTIKKDNEFVITEKLLEEETETLYEESDPSLVFLERKIVSLKANGYVIETPLGRKVTSVDLKGFVTLADKRFLEDLQDIVHLSFPNQQIVFHTLSLALLAVSTTHLEVSDYILFAPESHATTVLFVKGKTIENISKIQFGKVSLTQLIAQELDTHLTEAHSLLSLWFEDKLDESKKQSLETVMKNSKDRWHMLLKGMFSRLSKTTLLPQSIFFVDNSLNSHVLGSWITSEAYSNQALSINPFTVAFFTHKDLLEHLRLDDHVKPESIHTDVAVGILFARLS